MSSSSANGDEAIASESKFKGEAYEIRDNRTVFVGSMEDSRNREDRVLLLAGPSSAGKTSLIDFLCNYFYGVRNAESQTRYRIANEKFDAASPERPIVTYIFNDTIMDYRPIVIDTPGAGKRIGINDASTLLAKWLLENKRMRLDAIGIVFSDVNRMTSAEEDELQKMISNFPVHVRSNMIVFVTDCDESAPQITRAILQRFNLQDAKIFRINSTCLYEKLQGDSLKEQLRQNYWKSSVEMFDEATNQIKANAPVTISGEQFNPAAIVGAHQPSRRSSTSSASDTTVIHVPQSPRTHAVPPPSILTPVPPPAPLIPPPLVPVFEPVAAPISIPLPYASIPAESQPPKKVPRVGDRAEFASVRSSNYDYPNLPISSDLSSTASESTRRKSKVTETHIYESKEVGSERQRLLPSEPIRMTDFSRVVESREPEPRRSIFYSPYSSSSSQLYVRPSQPPPVPPHGYTNISSSHSKSTSNVQETGAVAADTVRTYAQETTPPPVQHTDIANTYSTTSVTYVNNEQPRSEMIRTSHSPRQLKKETNAGLKDAIRLSREELRIAESTGQDDMTSVRYRQPQPQPQPQYIPPSQPLAPTPIGRGVTPRGTTFSAGGTIIGAGVEPPKQIIRYAYDNDRHTYRPHAASTASRGESRISRKIERTVERRWSSSEAPRTETVIDDPAYDLGGRDISRGYGTVEIRRSKQSLASHKSSLHGSMPELVHSEDMTHVQERMPYKERIIDFPISQSKSTFDRDVQIRKSMRQSGGHEHQIGSGAGPKEIAIDVHITPRPSQIQQQTATTVTDQQRYENAPGQQPIPRYEDVTYAYAQPQRADYATTKGTAPQGGYATGQQTYRDSEYGSTWDDKAKGQGQSKMISTTTTDMRKSGQYATRNERNLGQPQYQPYQPSQPQRPIALPDPNDAEKGLMRDGKTGMSRDEQYHSSYRHQSRGRKSKSQTKSSSKEPTRVAFLNWTPSDYRDPYNCCLNFLYFVFAPLIILAIIITIIVLVIFEH